MARRKPCAMWTTLFGIVAIYHTLQPASSCWAAPWQWGTAQEAMALSYFVSMPIVHFTVKKHLNLRSDLSKESSSAGL